MGTRGAYGFHVGGVDKVTYNHHDSYPEGLGATIAEFLGGESLDGLRAIAKRLIPIDGKTPPTADQKERFARFADLGVSRRTLDDWYCLLREAQGEPWAWVQGLDVIHDDAAFLLDSLMCEWAYVINVDDGVLEVYRGFNKDPGADGRYASKQDPRLLDNPIAKQYFGVRLLETVPLAKFRGQSEMELKALLDRWESLARDEEDES